MADLDDKFKNKVESLSKHAKEQAAGQINEGQSAWDSWADEGPDEPGPERFLGSFREEFNRTQLGKEYIGYYSTSGDNTGEATEAKLSDLRRTRLQFDWLMQCERDFLLRRRSRIRTEAHAAAIRRAYGEDTGPIINGVLRQAKMMLDLASKKDED